MVDMSLPTPGFDSQALLQSRSPQGLRLSRNADPEAVQKSAREFEGVFISQMLAQMWQGVEVDENFGGGHAEETFRSLLVEEYGKEIARQGGIGIADHVARTLLQTQEVVAEPQP